MSIDGMYKAWAEMEVNAQRFRELAAGFLLEGQAPEEQSNDLPEALNLLLSSSEKLRLQGDSALRDGEDYGQVSMLMLGAAAVDAMLARDAAILDPDIDHGELEAWFESVGGRIEDLEEDGDLQSVFAEGGELLDEVGRLFGGEPLSSAGRSPEADRSTLVNETKATVADLVGRAEDPARELARGLITVAIAASGELLSAVVHLDVVKELERNGEKTSRHAPWFLREHVAKIATLRSEERILDEMAKKIGEEVEERADPSGVVGALLGFIAAPMPAIAHAEQKVGKAPEIFQVQGQALLADLTTLQTEYRQQMHWIGKSARWLRRGARPMVHLGALAVGPLSYAIGAGVFFVGLGYVGYSLTDRIDQRHLGPADRIEGVVRLIDRHIPD